MSLWLSKQHQHHCSRCCAVPRQRLAIIFVLVIIMTTGQQDNAKSTVIVDAAAMIVIDQQLTDLANRHGLVDRGKNILQPRHMQEYEVDNHTDAKVEGDDGELIKLFHEFGKAVCQANCIPRKELLEAWAMAQYVHHHFPLALSHRIADLACGHGLLAYALLLLDSTEQRTAICIDRRMPKYMDKISESMTQRFGPKLQRRWDYVEGHVERIESSSTTLLVGIHCCGGLSDKVIELAIAANAPLALVPCCHTRKCLPLDVKKNIRSVLKDCNMTIAEYIDTIRIERLKQAGYTVEEKRIPTVITPKNRIILATPSSSISVTCIQISPDGSNSMQSTTGAPPRASMETAPLLSQLAVTASQKKFVIPVADTEEAKSVIRSMAGRLAADLRRRKHPPSLGVSLWLPNLDMLTLRQLNELSDTVAAEIVSSLQQQSSKSTKSENEKNNYISKKGNTTQDHYDDLADVDVPIVTKTDYESEAYLNPNGIYSRTFKIYYQVDDDTGKAPQITRQQAKVIHEEVCRRIPVVFEGVTKQYTSSKNELIRLFWFLFFLIISPIATTALPSNNRVNVLSSVSQALAVPKRNRRLISPTMFMTQFRRSKGTLRPWESLLAINGGANYAGTDEIDSNGDMEVETKTTGPNSNSSSVPADKPKQLLLSPKMKGVIKEKTADGVDFLLNVSSHLGPSLLALYCLVRLLVNNEGGVSFFTLSAAALLGASCGFHLFLYFITLGYALGVTLPLTIALVVYKKQHSLPKLTIWHSSVAIVWGIRLFSFLTVREYITWPALHDKVVEVQGRMRVPYASKVLCWIVYSFFYVALMASCWSRLLQGAAIDVSSTASSHWGIVGYVGLVVQSFGLLLEATADVQKNNFKSQQRHSWCNVGVWTFSTHPNYLGEGLFWLGTYLSHGFYSFVHSLLATAGLMFVLTVLKGSAKSLSLKQKEKYGQDPTFYEFQRSHNVFGPKHWRQQQQEEKEKRLQEAQQEQAVATDDSGHNIDGSDSIVNNNNESTKT